MPLSILALTNNQDGRTVRAALNQSPSGTLQFKGKLGADGTVAVKSHVLVSGLNYDVTLRSATELASWKEPWLIQPSDSGGDGAFVAVWLGKSNEQDVEEIGAKLQSILRANIEFVKLEIRRVYPNFVGEIPVWREGAERGDGDLRIEIIPGGVLRDEFVASNRTRWIDFTAVIETWARYYETQSEVMLSNVMSAAVRQLLNLSTYNTMTLASGIEVANCQVTAAPYTESVQTGGDSPINWGLTRLQWSGVAAGFRA